MRFVIETSESDRDAVRKLAASLKTSYSVLWRVLFRMALDGTIPKEKLVKALKSPMPVLSVTLNQEHQINDKEPSTKQEREDMAAYLHAHPKVGAVYLAKWRRGEYK